MNDMQAFYILKQAILDKYRTESPYYTGDIQGFGNKEIALLIDLVEQSCHERVSEKWVYTHLKPLENNKLPRRDMLDIFSRWVGYAGWEEFIFKNKEQNTVNKQVTQKISSKKTVIFIAGAATVITGITLFILLGRSSATVCIKDRYTQKSIDNQNITLYLLKDNQPEKLVGKEGCYEFSFTGTEAHIAVQSAYYKPDTLIVNKSSNHFEFDLQPDDYAMMLRAYMNGNVADWQKRRNQLTEIISDNAVIQEVMFDDIGVEFLDKDEFIAKVTTPAKTLQTLEVVEVKYQDNKIISLKYVTKKQ